MSISSSQGETERMSYELLMFNQAKQTEEVEVANKSTPYESEDEENYAILKGFTEEYRDMIYYPTFYCSHDWEKFGSRFALFVRERRFDADLMEIIENVRTGIRKKHAEAKEREKLVEDQAQLAKFIENRTE